MALNPPIAPDGTPYRVDGEMFTLTRKELEFEIKIQNQGKLTGKGHLVLTTARLILVNTSSPDKWKAFDIPLAYLYNEKFQQPIFGANYLEGKTTPLYNLIPGDAHFKIWFMAGGCSKFLKVFHDLVAKMRNFRSHNTTGMVNNYVHQFGNGNFQNQYVAFSESNDPSTLFVTQPPVNNQYTYMQNHFAEMHMYNPSNINNSPSNMPPFSQQNNPNYSPNPNTNYNSNPNYNPNPNTNYNANPNPNYNANFNPNYPNYNPQMQNTVQNQGNIQPNFGNQNSNNSNPPQFYEMGANANKPNFQSFSQNINNQNPNMGYQPPVPNQYPSGQNPNIMNQNNSNQYSNLNSQPPVFHAQSTNPYPEF